MALTGGVDYVVADLATTLCGKRQVPLPFFFSHTQNAHILMDAGVGAVVTSTPELFTALPKLQIIDPVDIPDGPLSFPDYLGGADRVIYTSGSSGRPKGVIIGDPQLSASLTALALVINAGPQDRHLSILPLAQLLEQICGIFLPILAGAETVMRFEATKALFGAPIAALTDAFEEVQPSTSLLAPGLLGRWVQDLKAASRHAPASLRFVAVGGASSSPALIYKAASVRIPVHEGYGLSECCAVVAMNRPGQNRAGSVGQVLDGLEVEIINNEITVTGPTIMAGYLNGTPAPERWYTGDLGHFDGDRLVIDGRKYALLVTPAGRNISPEWIESRVNADPRIVSSALALRQDGTLILIVVAVAPITGPEIVACLSDVPAYTQPDGLILTDPSHPDLVFAAGTPNRAVAHQLVNTADALPLAPFQTKESLAS
ncbi:Bifunctional protein Aas [Roseovarius litorisediminis]|uniref:Bifunctional protein Aas n=1 Tax=Roseovarius litorisediminis TaxID=1312363 RepID=A0A1Y5TQ80_9RHOB|nr:AMP-binding protein [Roseovarius litorisediminis]SLN65604.1 Bifunctional protein Aas [Roseovarius litorisediminis]